MRLYTAIICTNNSNVGQNGYIKWHNVSSIDRLISNVKKTYPCATFVTIYDKKTREKINVISINSPL